MFLPPKVITTVEWRSNNIFINHSCPADQQDLKRLSGKEFAQGIYLLPAPLILN
jgi:hypothetical protein